MTEPTAPQVEASDAETITIEFQGNSYVLPATPDQWDFTTLELFENGKAIAATEAILGADQYAAFKATRPTVGDFNELMNELAKRYGFESSGN